MDTKALDEILKVAKCTQFPFEMIDQAAAELAELKDLAISWQARWDTCDKERMKLRAELELIYSAIGTTSPTETLAHIAKLQTELDGARKVIDAAAHELGIPIPGYIQPVANAAYMLWAWLKAHPERKGNDMSDTKALERALNLVLENDVLCASYGGVFREAAAELADLKLELELCTNRDLVWEEHTKLTQLRAELDEARKVIQEALNELTHPSEPCDISATYILETAIRRLKAHPE